MMLQNLQAAMRRKPFKPFSIQTSSGEGYLVRHPEMLSVAPDTTVVLLIYGPDQTAMIDIGSIAEVIYDLRPVPQEPEHRQADA